MNEEFRIICDDGSLRIYKGDYGFNVEEIVDLLNEQRIIINKQTNEINYLKQEINSMLLILRKYNNRGKVKELLKELSK